MPIRVIVNGAFGKMGVLACETLRNNALFELVATLTKGDNLKEAIAKTKAEVVIDLTSAYCVYDNALQIIMQGAHPVIGTSGLTQEQINNLKLQCDSRQLGGIVVPNFSISAVLMMRFAKEAAQYLSEVEIIEAHHPQKYDAPSGTAVKTAEMIAEVRAPVADAPGHESIPGVRGGKYCSIPIHSLRLPGILARQQVIFGSRGETLSICHDTIDRASFMPGIVLCCQKVKTLDSLYCGLEYLL